ncbi:MAG: peroxiredoxin-like family protein [Pseudomonadota bacterium]
MTQLLPTQAVPELSVATVQGETYTLSDSDAENFTLVLFYRGLHCPICRAQLSDLQRKLPDLEQRGIKAVAISMDSEERAKETAEKWRIDALTLGYGLTEEQARSFGLYLSDGINDGEPQRFSEPGLFLVRPDGTLYFGSVQTMPFTRPPLGELIQGIDYALEHGYPARGEVPS